MVGWDGAGIGDVDGTESVAVTLTPASRAADGKLEYERSAAGANVRGVELGLVIGERRQ
jgi:hypothetical protein